MGEGGGREKMKAVKRGRNVLRSIWVEGGSLLVVEGEGQGWELGRILEKGDQSWNGGGLSPPGKSVVGNRFVLGLMRSRLRNKGSLEQLFSNWSSD